jgi:hypothetical protein
MFCVHCGTAHPRARFCFRCGKKLLSTVPYGREALRGAPPPAAGELASSAGSAEPR